MTTLIDELLGYSRLSIIEKGTEKVDTEKILTEAIDLLSGVLTETKGVINFEKLPAVYASETALKLVFQNLIGNAIKYQEPNVTPIVEIKASETDNSWQFSIKDNGIGIKKEYHNQIFQLFKRLHSREEYAGSGMGLATCKKIINKNGGDIWLESEIGIGSTFYFTIPKKLA
jgi:light-regulated signal transduction histidine kinase (bacteriophytochrome)